MAFEPPAFSLIGKKQSVSSEENNDRTEHREKLGTLSTRPDRLGQPNPETNANE